jgi:hypothetical protein
MNFYFGKHLGRPVEDVPDAYLRWCLAECNCLNRPLREAIEKELERRGIAWREEGDDDKAEEDRSGSFTRKELSTLVADWFRELSVRWHPEYGGDHQTIEVVNDAYERLRQALKL